MFLKRWVFRGALVFHKHILFLIVFTSGPKLDWKVIPYKVYEPLGAYVVICAESEDKLQTSSSKVKEELSHYRNVSMENINVTYR